MSFLTFCRQYSHVHIDYRQFYQILRLISCWRDKWRVLEIFTKLQATINLDVQWQLFEICILISIRKYHWCRCNNILSLYMTLLDARGKCVVRAHAVTPPVAFCFWFSASIASNEVAQKVLKHFGRVMKRYTAVPTDSLFCIWAASKVPNYMLNRIFLAFLSSFA